MSRQLVTQWTSFRHALLLIALIGSLTACDGGGGTPGTGTGPEEKVELGAATITFRALTADSALKRFSTTYRLQLEKTYMHASGLFGSDELYPESNPGLALDSARLRVITTASLAITGMASRQRALAAQVSAGPLYDTHVKRARDFLTYQDSQEELRLRARSGRPLVWAVVARGPMDEIARASRDPLVAVYQPAEVIDGREIIPRPDLPDHLYEPFRSARVSTLSDKQVTAWIGSGDRPILKAPSNIASLVLETYYPTHGDLYYDGSEYFHTYLTWERPGGWAKVLGHSLEIDLALEKGYFSAEPYRRATNPLGKPPCSTWTTLPKPWYDDCPTAGHLEGSHPWSFSFGTWAAKDIQANTPYFGQWFFWGGRAINSSTIGLSAQENFNLSCPGALNWPRDPWCMDGVHSTILIPEGRIDRGREYYKEFSTELLLPTITRISPSTVPQGQATWLTITGGGFKTPESVTVAGNPLTAAAIKYINDKELMIQVTMGGPGDFTAEVVIQFPGGRSAKGSFQVAPAPVATVDVIPGSAEIAVGGTRTFSAVLKAADGGFLTRPVEWKSSAPSVASVNQNGVVTGLAGGTATITAASEGKSGTARVTVTAPSTPPPTPTPVATVIVSPSNPSINVGQTVQMSATPKDGSGNVLEGRTVTWQSSYSAVATVSPSGLVTGVGAGTALVSATSEGKSSAATVTVSAPTTPPPPSPAPVATVSVSPPNATLDIGGTVQLKAVATDASGNVLTGRSVTWSSANPAVATVASGLVTAVSAGTARITAESEGKSGSAEITVSAPVAPPPPPPAPPTPNVAAKLLGDGRASINPAMLSGHDLTKEVWLAGDLNEFMGFQEQTEHRGTVPARRYLLNRGADGWYETRVPVAGMLFTTVQFNVSGNRTWPSFAGKESWEGVWQGSAGDRPGSIGIRLPRPGYPDGLYNSWIRACTTGGRKYLLLSAAVLPVDDDQLQGGWTLVGEWNGWNRGTGLVPTSKNEAEVRYDITGLPTSGNLVNVQAPTIRNTTVWGRFGWLGTGELWGYKHPLVLWNQAALSASIDLSNAVNVSPC